MSVWIFIDLKRAMFTVIQSDAEWTKTDRTENKQSFKNIKIRLGN